MRFTIFTPTFNRRHTLHRVYDSLCAQTLLSDHFEWLVVDDGSRDDTESLVRSWAAEAPFPIRYVWQENGGKHRAWNRGVAEARGELFAFMDSDDACTPDALARLASAWCAVDAASRTTLAGIITRCQYPDARPVGPRLPASAAVDFAELVLVFGYDAETWIVTRTDVLRAHPFPEGPRGKLVPEGTLWHRVARSHRWLLLDEPLRIYYAHEFGSTDQLSRPKPLAEQAPGLVLAYESLLANSWRHFGDAPLTFARSALHLARFSLHGGRPLLRGATTFPDRGARVLYASLIPVGVAAFLRDKLRRR